MTLLSPLKRQTCSYSFLTRSSVIFFADTSGNHPSKAMKTHLGPFFHLIITVIVVQRRVCSAVWIQVVKLKLALQHVQTKINKIHARSLFTFLHKCVALKQSVILNNCVTELRSLPIYI